MTQAHTQSCPIARVLNVLGDNWTWLIVREGFYGATRFSEFERNTGIAKNLLSNRLNVLVEKGIFAKIDVGESGKRYSYRLTEKGKALRTMLYAMIQWGNDYLSEPGQEPVVLVDKVTGKVVKKMVLLSDEGNALGHKEVNVEAGPGAEPDVIAKLEAAYIAIAKKQKCC